MWWTKQDSGFRGWVHVKRNNGKLRTGLVSGDFTITIRDPGDTASNSPVVSESGKTGLYRFDIPSSFLLSGGVGEYGAVIEVDTFAGPSSAPNVRDSISSVLRVSQQDFDSLVVSVDAYAIADAVWDESISTHTTAGTFGATNQGTTSVDAYEIADAVWSTQVSAYFDNIGSFGKVLGFNLSAETTVTGGTASAIQTGLTQATNFWADHQVVIYDQSSGERVVRSVGTYSQTNGTISFTTALPFTPAVGDLVLIMARASSTTATATIDLDAIADAVWDENFSGHTTSNTFGTLQNLLQGDGYSLTIDPPTNTRVTIDRGRFANSMITGAGAGSIQFVAATRRLTISVRKRNISISVDGGSNYLVLPTGVNVLSIGWIKKLLIKGDGTWEIIASFG